MSQEASVTNNAAEAATEQKEEKYTLEVTSHEPFNAITSSMYIDSRDLCKKVSDFFKMAFADCYGSTFDPVPGTQNFMISLYFDHDNHDGEIVAVSKDALNDNTVNSTLRRTRRFQNQLLNGDHFSVTKQGMEAIAPFMFNVNQMSHIYKGNRYSKPEVDWKKVCSETADSTYGYNASPRQLTKISFIDPDKLIEMIFGDTSDEGDKYVYTSRILRSLPSFGSGNVNFKLEIQRIAEKNVIDLANQMGLGYQAGLNIIR